MTTLDDLRSDASDHIAEISLARAPVNALSLALLEQLLAALRRAAADDKVRAVVLMSALPRHFSAGLGLRLLLCKPAAEARRVLSKNYVGMSVGPNKFLTTSTCAARGGGMTLAISCDVLLAGASATFGYPEIELGLVPAIHFVHLPKIVGRHRAFELLFSGRTFGAEEAFSLGLVSRIVPDEQLREEARALARALAAKSRTAMRLGRAQFLHANDDRRGIADAVENFCKVAATADAQEGLRAFIEKRAPNW